LRLRAGSAARAALQEFVVSSDVHVTLYQGLHYVDRLWNLTNWADVTRRLDAARAARQPIILAP
jgi:hypothetical protein